MAITAARKDLYASGVLVLVLPVAIVYGDNPGWLLAILIVTLVVACYRFVNGLVAARREVRRVRRAERE